MTDRGRIAFDAALARPSSTGVGIYVRELARALVARAPERISLIGVRRDGPLDGLDRGAGHDGPDGHEGHEGADGAHLDRGSPFRGRGHLSWVQCYADDAAVASGAELAHYTNGLAPLRARVPFVVTIQDLTFIRYPLHHPPLRLARIPFAFTAANAARVVVVPSRATARAVERVLRVPSRRIAVVGYAPRPQLPGAVRVVGSTPAYGSSSPRPTILERLRLRPGRYVLSLGGLDARKNQERVVAAFELLGEEHADLRLVLVGAGTWRQRMIRRRIDESPARDRVVIAGFVPDDDLADLLAQAGVFAYVSLGEGFGLPILEAMAAGAPVLTSRLSSMPEVAGGAAVLVDPRDPAAIAAGIDAALGPRREELVTAGRARAAARSWDDVAGDMLDVYDRALR